MSSLIFYIYDSEEIDYIFEFVSSTGDKHNFFKLVLDIFSLIVNGQTLCNPDTSLKHVVEYKYLLHPL